MKPILILAAAAGVSATAVAALTLDLSTPAAPAPRLPPSGRPPASPPAPVRGRKLPPGSSASRAVISRLSSHWGGL
ncbi:hypothetical protein [Paracoccus sanguinis]|uniref:Uncharacterized protein n=1 Tax=Paracoccus sanguinis TaxID=1545044 RepID=A0A099G2E4_9RHOB|nr:hypothetical protein [Paracoccus sanguinis]KGJ16816.1 hypothetical protein IX56_17750 [Paracoccus sanguinis]